MGTELSGKCFGLKKKTPKVEFLPYELRKMLIRIAIVKSPRRSVRRHSAAIGLSDRSVRRILHKDLNFHPVKIATVQELSDHNMANRRISSEQLLKMLNGDGVINTVLMTDEAHFHLSDYVNKQNYRYWAPENPQELHQRPLHSERFDCLVWDHIFWSSWPLHL